MTTLYFEAEREDDLRRVGYSKDRRVDPLNRPGFGGGSDDTEGSLSWDRRSIPMSCASELRGRALDALADPTRAKGAGQGRDPSDRRGAGCRP